MQRDLPIHDPDFAIGGEPKNNLSQKHESTKYES